MTGLNSIPKSTAALIGILLAALLSGAAVSETVSGAEVLRMLEMSPEADTLKITDVVVEGDLLASGIDSIRRPVEIVRATFLGNVDLTRIVFAAPVSFEASHFRGAVSFSHSTLRRASFAATIFSGPAAFDHVRFDRGCNFRDATFRSTADFSVTWFYGVSDFSGARFDGSARLSNAEFNGWVNLVGATFEDGLSFRWSAFTNSTTMADVVINGAFDARGSRFSELDLRGAALAGASVLLEDSRYGSLLLDRWSAISGQLSVLRRDENRDAWRTIPATDLSYDEASAILTPLKSNFRSLGRVEDELDCLFDLKEVERHDAYRRLSAHPGSWLDPVRTTILWASCGYGVRPARTLILAVSLILVCSIAYSAPGAIVEQSGQPRRFRSRTDRFRDAVYFSLNTFNTVGYGDWRPSDSRVQIGKLTIPFLRYRTIATFEGMAGWVLITVFIISLGMTWLR